MLQDSVTKPRPTYTISKFPFLLRDTTQSFEANEAIDANPFSFASTTVST